MNFLGGNQQPQGQEPEYVEDNSPGYFPQNYQPMGGAPLPRKFDSDFLRLYDVDDIIEQIENFLRGRKRDDNGEFKDVYTSLMDEQGINLLMGDLRFHLHKIVFLSNLSKEDVLRMGLEMRKMIVRWIYLNWWSYKIDKTNLDRIVYNIDHAIYCSLMKPLNDRERIHLGETTTRSENVMVTQEPRGSKRWFF